jgi:hypothetical protein
LDTSGRERQPEVEHRGEGVTLAEHRSRFPEVGGIEPFGEPGVERADEVEPAATTGGLDAREADRRSQLERKGLGA